MNWRVGIALLLSCMLLVACAKTDLRGVGSTALLDAKGCELLLDPERSTFVLHEVQTGQTYVCNAGRAAQRFIPASTFKIPHALVALETGVVTNEFESFRWDEQPRGVKAWDKDTSLADAFPASTVWVFQDIASRIGHEREAKFVRRLSYGNMDVGGPNALRHFWLSGPLEISAVEQLQFLRKLRAGQLAVDRNAQKRVVTLLRLRDCGQNCIVYGKTGAMLPIDDGGFLRVDANSLLPAGRERTGWYVGWIERPESAGGAVVFVHNLDLGLPGAMAARTKVADDVLQANGVQTRAR